MEQGRYDFEKVSEAVIYEFFSEGPKGRIRKVVKFTLMEDEDDRIFNLSFGDSTVGTEINDQVTSNNADSQKILNTVTATMIDFVRDHRDDWIFVRGATSARTRLYQMVISRHWKNIALQIVVLGSMNGEWMHFRKGLNFQAFLIGRK
jgi:hypothetical protein